MFNKWEAQRWWGENYDRVVELYNVQTFRQQGLSTPSSSVDDATQVGSSPPPSLSLVYISLMIILFKINLCYSERVVLFPRWIDEGEPRDTAAIDEQADEPDHVEQDGVHGPGDVLPVHGRAGPV